MDIFFYLMLGLVLAATLIDFKHHKIPNWLTIGGSVIGTATNVVGFGLHDEGILWSLLGVAAGICLFLPIYAWGKMGAGDVKLLGMVGSFLGPVGVFWAAAYSVIAGGLLAIGWLVYKFGVRSLVFKLVGSFAVAKANKLDNAGTSALDPDVSKVLKGKMPYGFAIAVGAIASYTVR